MKRIALAALVATFATAAAFADPTPKKTAAKPAVRADLVCPVTGEKIASIADAAGSTVYKGKTYYFCCSGCKPAFDKNPAKYVKTASVSKSTSKSAVKATAAKTS